MFALNTVSMETSVQVTFTFIPGEVGASESMWELSIPERAVNQKIRLVGMASEPSVTVHPVFLKLRPTLIGKITANIVSVKIPQYIFKYPN